MATSTPNGLWSPDPTDLVVPLEGHLAQMQQSVDDLAVDIQGDLADLDSRKTETLDEVIVTGSPQGQIVLNTTAGFSTLRVTGLLRAVGGDAAVTSLRCRFNGDSGNNYDTLRRLNIDGTMSTSKDVAASWITCGRIPDGGSAISANNIGAVQITLPHARGVTNFKPALFQWGGRVDTGTLDEGSGWGQRRNVEVVTTLRFFLPSDREFAVGSRMTIEGVTS